ncbi:hypothetical protein Syun_019680 [Stephania yunnanensis]|uniref:non-specific serine/threonine protein kinase n=1 Tax=Stephania yunnanensis TaxID=152371 RepID=A0AAP0NWW4_9MAGN
MIDNFKHIGPNGQHFCVVLEFLGDSLLRLIRYNRNKGLLLNKVREIRRCILVGLDYLHREVGVIHTDLKPENVLLVSTIDPSKDPVWSEASPILDRPEGNLNTGASVNIYEKKLKKAAMRAVVRSSRRRASIGEVPKFERSLDGIDLRCKIVDLGNSCWVDKQFSEEIQTRQYRASEVILDSGHVAHLAQMMELLGKMPRKIATGGSRWKSFFDRYGDLERRRRLKFCPLDRLLVEKYNFLASDAREFSNFLCPLLDFAPEKRPTAQQCLQHPWIELKTRNNACEIKRDASVEKLETVINKRVQIKVGH